MYVLYVLSPTFFFRYDALQKVGFFALGPGAFLFVYNSCRWLLYELWPVMRRTMLTRGRSRPVSGALADQRREETRLLYSGMFVISMILCMLFLGVNGATANAIANWNPNQVMYSNLAYITFVLTLSILAMRTVKFEMVQSLYALIEGTSMVLHIPHLIIMYKYTIYDLTHTVNPHCTHPQCHQPNEHTLGIYRTSSAPPSTALSSD